MIHCPKCRKAAVRGLVQSGRIRPQRRGKMVVTMRETKCLDCGHVWWSTIFATIDYAKFKHAEV